MIGSTLLRIRVVVLLLVAAIFGIGAWSYRAVERSLVEARGDTLRTFLNVQSEALERWIADLGNQAEQLADSDEVRRSVSILEALASSLHEPSAGLRWSNARAAITAQLESARPGDDDRPALVIVHRDGRVLHDSRAEQGEARLPKRELLMLASVLEGRPRFIAPFVLEKPQTRPVLSANPPAVWFAVPVRGPDGNPVAALCLGYPADRQFSHILRAARSGETGEAYAFDDQGVLLSDSLYTEQLKRAGAIPAGARSAMLGTRLTERPEADGPPNPDAPLTRLVAQAREQRLSTADADAQGLIMRPYSSYHGSEAVGAWRWLRRHDIGVAVEMSASQAFGPLHYLESGLVAVAALLGLGWFALFVSPDKWVRSLQGGALRKVGPYRIVRQIGEGSISNVYLARHQLLARPAAVKVLKPQSATDEWIARFEREVQLASQLTHPNTISIFDYGHGEGGQFYYAMEYLEGLSMADLVERYGPLPPGRAAYLLRQVCESLGEAHANGLIHRDIKPQNVMVCELHGERDVVKVLDFGLVKRIGGQESRDLTRSLRILGTPLYMAPERIHNPADVGPRTDIYSIGAVGFFLLTGRRLFETDNDHDLTYHILHVVPPRASARSSTPIPPELDELLFRCLAKDPASRPASTLEVRDMLDAVLATHPWTARQINAWWRENWVSADSPLRRLPGA